MSLFSRFFGKKADDDTHVASLTANPAIQSPLSLQVLFEGTLSLTSESVTEALRAYTPSMSAAQCELDVELSAEGKLFGILGWGKHVIKLVGFDLPMPADAVEACVAPAHYPQVVKAKVRAHTGHLLLFYAGYETKPLEQYVALATTSGALAKLGAIAVLNESAHTSLPTGVLAEMGGKNALDVLRSLPLLYLYCGFVKYEVEGTDGVWMRSYGAHLLGLPDFAALAAGHHEGEKYFEVLGNILSYLQTSGAKLAAGHTMQIGPKEYFRVRQPSKEEYFLESPGTLFVAEIIGPDQINR